MNKIISIVFFSLILTGYVFSQWENVYTNNTWSNGASLFVHNNILFQNLGAKTLRLEDDVTTWTDISSSFPTDLVLNIFSFKNNSSVSYSF